jgi:hypothetical protein
MPAITTCCPINKSHLEMLKNQTQSYKARGDMLLRVTKVDKPLTQKISRLNSVKYAIMLHNDLRLVSIGLREERSCELLATFD